MTAKREFIINELMVDDFIERESKIIEWQETEDTGKSILEFQLVSDENFSIKNVDKKNTIMNYFKSNSTLSMNKRVDHIVFEHVTDKDWKIHLIEMKSSVGSDKWKDVKGKFRASYLLAQGIAAMLEMNIVDTYMYTSYERVCFELSKTMPVDRRLQLGKKHVKPQDEWEGDDFSLNFGIRINFKHKPIQMRRNDESVLIGKYVFS